MSNQDIRAKILEDIYNKKQEGKEILTRSEDYVKLLGISEEKAEFNIQYLIKSGLLRGEMFTPGGTTVVAFSMILDITSFGIEAVEGYSGQGLAINYNIININAPITQSQIGAGKVTQQQSININTLDELLRYLNQKFEDNEISELRNNIIELKDQVKKGEVKTNTLSKIKELARALGPTILQVVMKVIEKYG